jgi:hypothetical protein
MSMIRTRAAWMTAFALASLTLVAACGGSSGSAAAASTDQVAHTAGASLAATTQAPDASAAAVSGGCATWQQAAETLSLETKMLFQADSAAQWKAMTDPTAPIVLSGDRMAKAVAILSATPGSADLMAKYRAIAELEKQAVASTDPWGAGNGPGAQVQQTVSAAFVDLGTGLGNLLSTLGC